MAYEKNATVHYLSKHRFMGSVADGNRIIMDGNSENKAGMTPMDLLLNAVGGCAAFDISSMIEKRQLEIVHYHIELEGSRAEGTPKYFTHIHAKHIFNVPGLEQKMAERFVDLGMNKYCSVAASLNAEISFEVVLEHAEDTQQPIESSS